MLKVLRYARPFSCIFLVLFGHISCTDYQFINHPMSTRVALEFVSRGRFHRDTNYQQSADPSH